MRNCYNSSALCRDPQAEEEMGKENYSDEQSAQVHSQSQLSYHKLQTSRDSQGCSRQPPGNSPNTEPALDPNIVRQSFQEGAQQRTATGMEFRKNILGTP